MLTTPTRPSVPDRRGPHGGCGRGFTLIELVVVLAVIGLLVALLLPAVQRAREAARRTSCRNHLRQMGVALHNHHDQHRSFPPGALNEWSWITRLLPHLGHGPAFRRFDFSRGPFQSPNTGQLGHVVPVLLCPSDPFSEDVHVAGSLGGLRFAHTNYVGSMDGPGNRGMFGYSEGTRVAEVTDGTSQTIFVGERGVVYDGTDTHGWWTWGGEAMIPTQQPFEAGNYNDPTDMIHWWSYHPEGANFLFVDGSVRTIAYSVDQEVMAGLGTKDGGEAVNF